MKLTQPYYYYINEKCIKIPSIAYKAFPQTLHGSFSSHASVIEKEALQRLYWLFNTAPVTKLLCNYNPSLSKFKIP